MINQNTVLSQKILILAANPKNTSPLRLDQEMREIDEGLRRSKKREHFALEKRLAVRIEDLRRALLDEEPQFVHFCGHGAGHEGILLEDLVGYLQSVKAAPLANLFKLFSKQIICVILNACYSEVQAAEISQHINYVIGMKQAIGDQAAIKFATGFYDAIGAGRSIEDAFEFGKNAIELENLPEELTPVILRNIKLLENSLDPVSSVKWAIVLSGTIDDINKSMVETIVKHLQQISGDTTLTLHKIEPGSIILTMQGDKYGFERIISLLEAGEIKELSGFSIERVQLIPETDNKVSIQKRNWYFRKGLKRPVKIKLSEKDVYLADDRVTHYHDNDVLQRATAPIINSDHNRLYLTEPKEKFSDSLLKQLKEIDDEINGMLPETGLSSPRKIDNKQTGELFSSLRLIQSLMQLGVPFEVVIEIPRAVKELFPLIIDEESQVTTSHIRKAVATILQSGYVGSYSESDYRRWANFYVRKYGDPDLRIKVRERDGNEVNLDYKFMTDNLIPHVIRRLLNAEVEELISAELFSSAKINEFADQLISTVKSIAVTSISYKALLYLAQDLALELPRPWLVTERNAKRVTEFHLNLLMSNLTHYENYQNDQFPVQKYHLSEAIYHSVSAILAIYAQYIGIGHSGSIHYLNKVLLKVENRVESPFLGITEIKGDLPAEISIRLLREKLRRIEVCIASCTPPRINDLYIFAVWVRDLAHHLWLRRNGIPIT